MIERRQYNESFRQQALEKVYTRGSGTVKVVAEDLNMSCQTAKSTRYYEGRDEALTALVDTFPLADTPEVKRRFSNLEANRRHKYRHRKALLRVRTGEIEQDYAVAPFDPPCQDSCRL